MTKFIKPGQLITVNNTVYKARKRECGCRGCDLNDYSLCPSVIDSTTKEKRYDCAMYQVILKRINT